MPAKIPPSSTRHPLHARRRQVRLPFGSARFLAVFEGLEGGFAIGASVMVALSFTELDRSILLATVIVTLIVNGFNNASVKYSSEHFLDELDGREKRSAYRHYFIPAVMEFAAYFVISLLSILPLLIIDDIELAIGLSVVSTLAILYLAGYWRGYILRMSAWRDAAETLLLGGGIIAVGLVSGYIMQLF